MTRSEMREHVFKLIFRVPFHDKNELREQIDYYFDDLTDVNDDDIPVNVAINEAVELAKSYGSDDNAASFVNGVLAKLV